MTCPVNEFRFTHLQKKCAMDSLIFRGVQGHGHVTLGNVKQAPWSQNNIQYDKGDMTSTLAYENSVILKHAV